MKYCFIRENRGEFRVEKMCRVLSVSPAGYYSWFQRPVPCRKLENERLLFEIRMVYENSRKTYGSPRVAAGLKQKGFTCSRNRVAKLMKENGIKAVGKRKYKVTTDSKHKLPVAPNLLEEKTEVTGPDQVWVSDITYIPTAQGWLYLASVMDLYSRRVVGWAMADHMRKELVMDALFQAINRRLPAVGLIHHSDRGSQYASRDHRKLLENHGMLCSMSGKGNCYDNAYAESFFGSLKSELIYRLKFRTRREAKSAIFDYIEVFYNRQRIHTSLGFRSPADFENLYHQGQKLKRVA